MVDIGRKTSCGEDEPTATPTMIGGIAKLFRGSLDRLPANMITARACRRCFADGPAG